MREAVPERTTDDTGRREAAALGAIEAQRQLHRLLDRVGAALAEFIEAPSWRGVRAAQALDLLRPIVTGEVQSARAPKWLRDRWAERYRAALCSRERRVQRPRPAVPELEVPDLDNNGEVWTTAPAFTEPELQQLQALHLPGHRRFLATITELQAELEALNDELRQLRQQQQREPTGAPAVQLAAV